MTERDRARLLMIDDPAAPSGRETSPQFRQRVIRWYTDLRRQASRD